MVRAENETDSQVLATFDAMIAAVPGVERKGAAMPYTSINGNMYAMVSKAHVIGLRLSREDLAAFMAEGGMPFEGTPGYINKEYGGVPTLMLGDAKALQRWFEKSHALASALKPRKAASKGTGAR